jgi:PII-like signaling protein
MKGSSLRFYVHENGRHRGKPLYEWLLEEARQRGIRGGTVFRSIAGFGRHGAIEEQHFFELAGATTVLVEFIVDDTDAATLMTLASEGGTPLFYVRHGVESGVVGETAPAPDPGAGRH